MEHLPVPAWALAVMAVSVPPALYSLVSALLNRGIAIAGEDRVRSVLQDLLEALDDGRITEEELESIVRDLRAK